MGSIEKYTVFNKSRWPNGKASDYGSEDSGFESRAGLSSLVNISVAADEK